MDIEIRVLQALEMKALSTVELNEQLGLEVSSDQLNNALYQLREQKSWIQKHPVIGGGCKTCACNISYLWRLTFSGRQELSKHKEQNT